jgi:hypothetical protein
MSEPQPPRRTLRSLGAVVAGFLVCVVLSIATDAVMHATGIFPPMGQAMAGALFLLATVYRTVYGVAGGYITARLAPARPIAHAVALGVLGLVASLAGLLATWDKGPEFGPKWYPLALVVIAVPSCWLGGKLLRPRA